MYNRGRFRDITGMEMGWIWGGMREWGGRGIYGVFV